MITSTGIWRPLLSRRCWWPTGALLLIQSFTVSSETIRLTIAGPQSANLPWIGVQQTLIVPESNRRLRAMGSDYEIQWREAYGGSLYKIGNTLEAIEIGLTDLGWVGTLWEPSKMPLQNVTYYTPFVSDDLPSMVEIFNELHDRIPALAEAWHKQNQVLLGVSGVETYHLMTTFPVEVMEDLRGRKILAPGPSATWLGGTGAVAVNGGLSTYYTQIRTGVADGALTILSGAYPYRIHEVAPYVTLVGIGAQLNGGIAANKNTWEKLPQEVRQVLAKLGREYSHTMTVEVMERYEQALVAMRTEGATITDFNPREKKRWINNLPNIGGQWVEATEKRGHPAREILDAYMEAIRARGYQPLKNWDQPNLDISPPNGDK